MEPVPLIRSRRTEAAAELRTLERRGLLIADTAPRTAADAGAASDSGVGRRGWRSRPALPSG